VTAETALIEPHYIIQLTSKNCSEDGKIRLEEIVPASKVMSVTMPTATTYVCETRLDELPSRTCAVIRRIETNGEEVQRLKSLGLCVGRQIEVVKTGDPLIVKIFGSRIGLSASLAECVWLEVCAPDHCNLS
jgi:Fe2+ transport system protein FeoA